MRKVERGEAADHHGADRQHHVPEIVEHLVDQAELAPVVGHQPAQREQLEVAAAGEQHDQQQREQEARDGVQHDQGGRGRDVEARAVAHRLGDAERDRDEVDEQRGPQAERDRHRHLLQHQVDHALVAEEALAEIEDEVVLHHDEEALVDRLVEAVHLLDALDQLLGQAARAAIGAAAAARRVRGRLLHRLAAARLPAKRSVALTAVPWMRASICSTGPPGAAWMMKKLTTMMPIRVGTTSIRRRRM